MVWRWGTTELRRIARLRRRAWRRRPPYGSDLSFYPALPRPLQTLRCEGSKRRRLCHAQEREGKLREKAGAMMFIELLFWKNAREAQDVRDTYNYKVHIQDLWLIDTKGSHSVHCCRARDTVLLMWTWIVSTSITLGDFLLFPCVPDICAGNMSAVCELPNARWCSASMAEQSGAAADGARVQGQMRRAAMERRAPRCDAPCSAAGLLVGVRYIRYPGRLCEVAGAIAGCVKQHTGLDRSWT